MKWTYASQRKEYGRALVELGKSRKDVVVLDADLSGSTRTADFAKEFPEHFFNCGIAEQNMMGVAAGLAASGKVVFASTFAVFATGRCWDQIRQSIAYPKLNVKICATHAGITVGGDGASHQTGEDVALMRTLPNFTVGVPSDAAEAFKMTKAFADWNGPCYMRMGRLDFPNVTEWDAPFKIGKGCVLRQGDDITLMGCGIMVSRCLEAAEVLERRNVSAQVINMSAIKPLDEGLVAAAVKKTGGIVTAEEHNVVSGMGAAVASYLAEHDPVPMRMVGMMDTFGESGEGEELMRKYGLTADRIIEAAEEVMRRR
ncbi:MAG: transketolase family protein [Methanomassiliicoccales archaeon]|nr:transketolase family protein [Methanomassiliicoccales archaeon]